MKRLFATFKQKNIGVGYLYFVIHFIVEVVCFFALFRVYGDKLTVWLVPFVYDFVAFVPQGLIGNINDRHPQINFGLIGTTLLIMGFTIFSVMMPNNWLYAGLILLCLGNACIHVDGAEITLRVSDGKLSHSAIFVAGGSFGVITGKLLASTFLPFWVIALFAVLLIPLILLANRYRKEALTKKFNACEKFRYHNGKIKLPALIILTTFVVVVRSYMGYSIPTSWNKTIGQTIIFYSMMGLGKALGGILSDAFGLRKMAFVSIIAAVPFLLFGDHIMLISIVGVLLFSMTMSMTLAVLVSSLPHRPGVAFGCTTIGLFLGAAPIFFIKISSFLLNCAIIIVSSLVCLLIMSKVIRKR